jgi:hypothetical protein
VGEPAFLDLMEALWQKEHHATDCYQATVDGALAFELLAYYAKESGRNEVQVHEWNGQLDNPEDFHLACLNEQNLIKARVAKNISDFTANISSKARKNSKLL